MFSLFKSERAQGLVEYALLIFLIGIVVVLALAALGVDIGNVFNQVENSFPS
jgi:pilus assembly protein Flp/PilA